MEILILVLVIVVAAVVISWRRGDRGVRHGLARRDPGDGDRGGWVGGNVGHGGGMGGDGGGFGSA